MINCFQFCFNFALILNFRRYTSERYREAEEAAERRRDTYRAAVAAGADPEDEATLALTAGPKVGRCRLTLSNPS